MVVNEISMPTGTDIIGLFTV